MALRNPLPADYYLEISQDTLINDPVIYMESSSPFPAYAVGDKISPNGFANVAWHHEPQPGQVLRVIDIIHYTWEIPSSHIGHKVRLAVELVKSS